MKASGFGSIQLKLVLLGPLHEKVFSTIHKLGAMEFLCALFSATPILALVLPEEPFNLVL